MDILTFLQDTLGQYIRQKDECLFSCPFCAHPKKKLSINLVTYKWKCWVCGAKGGHVLWLLKKLNISRTQIRQAKELFDDVHIKQYKETTAETELFLPSEYKPLWVPDSSYAYKHALSYLKRRGIRLEDVLRYRIGYCEQGTYQNRIIVPSFDRHNKLNYFVARSYYDDKYKYKNPPVSKNIVAFENLISWEEPIILVEGIFDAISVRRNTIPLLGKTISKNLERALVENNVKDVIIFLDNDAKTEALKLDRKLSQYGIETKVVLTSNKDAADLGFVNSWNLIHDATSIDFKDYISHRIGAK